MVNFQTGVLSFVIGSSIVSTFVTQFYLGQAYYKSGQPTDVVFRGNKQLPFWTFPAFAVPILYGLFNVLNVQLQESFPKVHPRLVATVVGAVLGLSFSLAGRFGLDLPKRIFGMTDQQAPSVHWKAPILYGVIFGLIVQSFNDFLIPK